MFIAKFYFWKQRKDDFYSPSKISIHFRKGIQLNIYMFILFLFVFTHVKGNMLSTKWLVRDS